MVAKDTTEVSDELDEAASEAVRDIKRGAKRVGRAIADGADAVDEALRPSFAEQLCDVARSIMDEPKNTPALARGLVRDHPLASIVSAAVVGAALAKLIRSLSAR